MTIEEYFDALLSGIGERVGYIKINKGALNTNEITESTTSRGRNIRTSVFYWTTISDDALHSLSCQFPMIDLLEFYCCKFDNNLSGSTINLDLPYTTINTLSLYAPLKICETMVLMSVYCMDLDLSKYFLSAVFKRALKPKKLKTIYICAKFIENICFKESFGTTPVSII